MILKLSEQIKFWPSFQKEDRKCAEITSQIGLAEIYRGPARDRPAPRGLEFWRIVVDGETVLSIDSFATPGYPARRRAKDGVNVLVGGELGTLTARGSLRPGGRSADLTYAGRKLSFRRSGRDFIMTSNNDVPIASFDGREWIFFEASKEAYAFVSFFIAAGLDSFMFSPLVELSF